MVQCQDIAQQLHAKFGTRKKYTYEVVGEEEVLFKMLSSNLSQVIGSLDEVRRRPKYVDIIWYSCLCLFLFFNWNCNEVKLYCN